MQIILKAATVNKYKSIQKRQTVEIDPHITTIVGMNESGKTSFLQAVAKTNYFTDDKDFKFDTTQDFPRNELVDFENSDEDIEILSCTYEISSELLTKIETQFGKGIFTTEQFTYNYNYKGDNTISGVNANQKKYLEVQVQGLVLTKETREVITKLNSIKEVSAVIQAEGDTDLATFKAEIKKLVDATLNTIWDNALAYHIFHTWVKPKMPKFWYFDDYYHLGGKININDLNNGGIDEKTKTANALFELARIKPNEIINSSDYERFVALLEASSNKITTEIFKYWSTNKNLDIEFRIQDKANIKYLDIRVRSQKHKISLPLDRRSKGFNWFFSFITWFSKIQADKTSDYILLKTQ